MYYFIFTTYAGVFSTAAEVSNYCRLVSQSRFSSMQWAQPKPWCRYPFLRWLAPEWSGYNLAKKEFEETIPGWRHLVKMHKEHKEKDDDHQEDFIDSFIGFVEGRNDPDWKGNKVSHDS